MCGRYTLRRNLGEVEKFARLLLNLPDLTLFVRPRFNIKPTQDVPVIREFDGRRGAVTMRWGLVPWWSKELNSGYPTWNARAETIATKPTFRSAYKCRRCLIPADGFHEWSKDKKAKARYFIHRSDDDVFAFAGLWESWGDDPLLSCTIVTTTPTGATRPFHNRSPVVLAESEWDAWMNSTTPLDVVAGMLRPAPDDMLVSYATNPLVNMGTTDDERCLEPVGMVGDEGGLFT